MRRLHCQLPVLFFGEFPSDLWFTGMGKIGTYYNAPKIECAHRRACKLLPDYNQLILTFHSIYDYLTTLLKAFNTNTLNFHQYFKDKLSSHQPSHMHNTRHRTNSNFNTPLFNHSKNQKCYNFVPSYSHKELTKNSFKNSTSQSTLKKTN